MAGISNMACVSFIKIPFGETSVHGQGSPVGSSPWWPGALSCSGISRTSDLAALSIGCPRVWQESQCPEPWLPGSRTGFVGWPSLGHESGSSQVLWGLWEVIRFRGGCEGAASLTG